MIYVDRDINEARPSSFTREEAVNMLLHNMARIDEAIRAEYATLADHELAHAFGGQVGNAGEAVVARQWSGTRSVTETTTSRQG